MHSSCNRPPTLTRRALLRLAVGGAGLSALGGSGLLAGCGGADIGFPTAPGLTGAGPAPGTLIDLVAATRAEPTGTLAQKIDLYSTVMDALSLTYVPFDGVLTETQNFLTSLPAVTRHTHGGRQATPATTGTQFFQSAYYGGVITRLAYEANINAQLQLDNATYIASVVASQSGAAGAALQNPQWVAAMMERNYRVHRVLGGLMRKQLETGLDEMISLFNEQTDPTRKTLAYGLLSDFFNRWIARQAAQAKTFIPATSKLVSVEGMSADAMASEVARIRGIVNALPLGPGYRNDGNASAASRSTSGDNQALFDAAKKSAGDSFLGSTADFISAGINGPGFVGETGDLQGLRIAESFQKPEFQYLNQGVDKLLNSQRNPVLNGAAKGIGQGLAINGLTALMGEFVDRKAAMAVNCGLSLVSAALDTAKYSALALSGGVTVVGGLVFGSLAAYSFYNGLQTAQQCKEGLEDLMAEDLNDIDRTPYEPIERPAVTNPNNAECDQLARAGVRQKRVRRPQGDGVSPDAPPSLLRNIACGLLTGSTRAPADARTLRNMDVAMYGLMLDHARRNQSTSGLSESDGAARFFASEFASLIRRQPGQTSVTVPTLTSAFLLCTGIGLAPMRNAEPKDLREMTFPQLDPLTEFGTGVSADVS